MSVLGKVYLFLSLLLLTLGGLWALMTLQANTRWVNVEIIVPQLDLFEPLVRNRYSVNLAALLAGWVSTLAILAWVAIRTPFRIRAAAVTQRRIRELEREVLELRTLPLRQQEEDEILAAEAHVDVGTKKVMTEKIRRDELARDAERRPGGGLRP